MVGLRLGLGLRPSIDLSIDQKFYKDDPQVLTFDPFKVDEEDVCKLVSRSIARAQFRRSDFKVSFNGVSVIFHYNRDRNAPALDVKIFIEIEEGKRVNVDSDDTECCHRKLLEYLKSHDRSRVEKALKPDEEA